MHNYVSHSYFSMDIHNIYSVLLAQCLCTRLINKINIREVARRSPEFIERLRDGSLTRLELASVRRYARSQKCELYQVVAVFTSLLSEGCLGFFFVFDPYCESTLEVEIISLCYSICQALQFNFLHIEHQDFSSSTYYYGIEALDAQRELYQALYFSKDFVFLPCLRYPSEKAVIDDKWYSSFIRFREPLMTAPQICLKRRRHPSFSRQDLQ